MNASSANDTAELRATWIAWIAGVALLYSETVHHVYAEYYTRNGFIVECINWTDLSAIVGGGIALIAFTVFFFINRDNASFGWKKWVRVFGCVDALRVFLYGFGIETGIGTGCDHI